MITAKKLQEIMSDAKYAEILIIAKDKDSANVLKETIKRYAGKKHEGIVCDYARIRDRLYFKHTYHPITIIPFKAWQESTRTTVFKGILYTEIQYKSEVTLRNVVGIPKIINEEVIQFEEK